MPLARPMRARARWASLRPLVDPADADAAEDDGRDRAGEGDEEGRACAEEEQGDGEGAQEDRGEGRDVVVVVGARGEPAGGGPAPRWAAAHRKPGAGLEPATPSLPWKCSTN